MVSAEVGVAVTGEQQWGQVTRAGEIDIETGDARCQVS